MVPCNEKQAIWNISENLSYLFWLVDFVSQMFFVCFSFLWTKNMLMKRFKLKMNREYFVHFILVSLGSFIKCVRIIFCKTNISYPLIHTRMCAYQGVRNFSFSEYFAFLLKGWSICYYCFNSNIFLYFSFFRLFSIHYYRKS